MLKWRIMVGFFSATYFEKESCMTRQNQCTGLSDIFELLSAQGLEGMATALQKLFNETMKLEREVFLNADAYERTPERRGYANGFKPKTVQSRVGSLELAIPQVRDVDGGESFYPRALERGERSERALKLALAEMYVQGVSTRKVGNITKKLCGVNVSSAQVSRLAQELDVELEKWRSRKLGPQEYLILDARYEKIRHGGHVVSAAVLIAIGIANGVRSILGVTVSLSEAEVNWREFLSALRERGLCGLTMILSDDHEGIKAALKAVFPGVLWNRCQVHLQRNAQGYAPTLEIRKSIARELRVVFNAPSREEAERALARLVDKYQKPAPKLASWLETNIPEGFSVYSVPVAHQRRLRTTNLIEWLNKEVLRRTRVAMLFPNEASLLRLVSAVLVEITEDWETGRRYLPQEDDL
jgi:transposase-like protein